MSATDEGELDGQHNDQSTEEAVPDQHALKKAMERITHTTSAFFGAMKPRTTAATKRTIGAVGDAFRRTGTATSAAVGWSRDLPARVRDLFTRECSIPVMLLPTGPGVGDFVCRFDFSEAVEELKHGVLVRPRLEVWAARQDVDQLRLSRLLKGQFASQLNAARERSLSASPPTLARNRTEARALAGTAQGERRKLGSGVAQVSAALVAMFLVANPLFDLLFLTLAFFGSGEVVKRFGSWFVLITASSRADRKVEREEHRIIEQMRRDLEDRNEAFRRAVANLEIRVHPVLHVLGQQFAEVELTSFPPARDGELQDVPVVNEMLSDPAFEREVPAHLRVLVQAHAG